MPPHRTPHPPAATPSRTAFDPWNSSATGHQRADNNRLAGSSSWRASRTMKLGFQYRAGAGGGKRVFDGVGAGSEGFGRDGRGEGGGGGGEKRGEGKMVAVTAGTKRKISEVDSDEEKQKQNPDPDPNPRIFQNLCIYLNGSTAPTISDHKLKHLLAEHGAQISLALGRRTVTHVILGTPNNHNKTTGIQQHRGAGGGLAAGKIQKEIKRVGGCGVRYVGVEW